ncbi:SMODS domain-containing nucleotidyltransferase [Sinorhizobium fredii]|uniref:SMODS domain-containing nucleotidyltransferase n=1 Tax=Rhizobium fredii TaxID=380 RepID=UPI000595672E|nr:nucleotidyltransferase [Sinorhizobium fredii]WOS64265.1 nucleotidyltransferase [Sinorhizobium fredii GR64]
MWAGVRQRFRRFHEDLSLSKDQIADGLGKQLGVRKSLHRAYYQESTGNPRGFIVGSWGKQTAVAPPSDVDIFFELPVEVYHRIESYQGNKQSALLQEVRGHLLTTYRQTNMRGDGQVVIVGFNTITVEVVPAFRYDNYGRFYMPDTNNGGQWKLVDPKAEIAYIDAADQNASGNVRPMAQMLKTWKRHCNVPLKSYQIELLVAEFMPNYVYRHHDHFYYDWFMRDFFIWLCNKAWANLTIPGTFELFNLGDAWLSRAQTARDRALRACDDEYNDYTISAGEEWQKIFGDRIPIHVQ